jgi:hypothetical protein
MKILKKSVLMLLITCMAVSGMSIGVFADAESKMDTQNRHVIYDQEDLEAVANDMTANYILANNIELSSTWTPLGWTEDSDDVPFTGTFDGNGYTISGLYAVYSADYSDVGLFAINDGTIKNLSLEISVVSGGSIVGAVAGQNNGKISNVTVTQSEDLSSYNCAVVGSSNPNKTDVNSLSGGIAGYNSNSGTVEECYVYVSVMGYVAVGGIVGWNEGSVSRCAFWGGVNNLISNQSQLDNCGFIGGLAGGNEGTISDCYSYQTANVKGMFNVGGAVGQNYDTGTIQNVYVYSYVVVSDGYIQCGDFCGLNQGTVSGSYVVPNGTYSESSQGGADVITSNTLKNQTAFKGKATNWDWNNVWNYNSYSYPVLRKCGNLGVNETIEYTKPTKEYTVTFNSGIHTNAEFAAVKPETVTAADGTSGTITLPEAPANTGEWKYDFKGWSDGDIVYKTGDEITVTKDVELTAVWQLHSVNGDKDWDYEDAMAIMDYVAGKTTFCKEQSAVADYNNDGTIDYKDAMKIMDVQAGK